VGTRKPSHYGITQTGSIARELAQKGITVISGLARGIDSEAHKGALEGGGITVAVLGCGLDINYPRENKNLCQSILEQGAVLSEFYFGTPPESKNFPRRNRVISGLSSGVLVTEAGERSGALITAAYGIDQNREVFALPGNVDRVQSKGCHNLIKSGRAHLITCAHDILEILNTQLDLKFDKTPPPEIHLPKELEKLYHSIDTEPMYIDEIALKAELSSSETLTKLLELEMMDLIKQLPGKWFQRG
jgi:DNA processing protein